MSLFPDLMFTFTETLELLIAATYGHMNRTYFLLYRWILLINRYKSSANPEVGSICLSQGGAGDPNDAHIQRGFSSSPAPY